MVFFGDDAVGFFFVLNALDQPEPMLLHQLVRTIQEPIQKVLHRQVLHSISEEDCKYPGNISAIISIYFAIEEIIG